MKSNLTTSGVVANPEYTKDGAYVIRFSNSTGLVVSGSQTPCFH
jgi:hypothetical protein